MAFIAADRPPAVVGCRLDDVDSPAAIVDLDALEGNIARALAMVPPVSARVGRGGGAANSRCPLARRA
jgi:hypothetical protein